MDIRQELKLWRHFDFALLGLTLLLLLYGLMMIYTATLQVPGGVSEQVYRQGLYALLGLALLMLATATDYRILSNVALPAYLVLVGILLVVLVSGHVFYGAQRWINLWGFPFQPSEPGKLLLVVALAKYLADHREQIHRLRYVLASLGIALGPTLLVFAEPDLGSAVIFLVLWAGMVVMAGLRRRHALLLGVAALLAMPLLWLVMQDYMRQRLAIFFNTDPDPWGARYNIDQAFIAVGSGGWFGRGFTSGTQSQLHFLRVQYADFIFAVLGEEWGFLGAVALLLLLLLLVLRGLRAAAISREAFGRLLATGVVTMIGFQAFVSVGMNIGLLPATGVTLPFISYGGSSLVTLLVAIGIVESIAMRHKKFELRTE